MDSFVCNFLNAECFAIELRTRSTSFDFLTFDPSLRSLNDKIYVQQEHIRILTTMQSNKCFFDGIYWCVNAFDSERLYVKLVWAKDWVYASYYYNTYHHFSLTTCYWQNTGWVIIWDIKCISSRLGSYDPRRHSKM